MSPITVYFIGGPADLSKWALPTVPGGVLYVPFIDASPNIVTEREPRKDELLAAKKAEYFVHRLPADRTGRVFTATYQGEA